MSVAARPISARGARIVDIPGMQLHRWDPNCRKHRSWAMDSETGCLAPLASGGLLLAQRHGLVKFDPDNGCSRFWLAPPYDPAKERFNDGKVDPHGRLWVGTIYEPRQPAIATLMRLERSGLQLIARDCTVSNGLAWSPDGRTAYWSDTFAHCIYAFDLDEQGLPISERRLWHTFADRAADTPIENYGGRPDGAAMDAEGCYWSALFEGQRLVRIAPSGELLQSISLPVRCPTMPCFGGPDGRILFITTARQNRPEAELAQQPLAGRVLYRRVDVPGAPVPMADEAFLPPCP
jgi:sugar lactone lactonase YvrE